MDHSQPYEGTDRSSSLGKWVLAGFLAVIAFFLWTEHRAHLLGVLPYLLVLVCPLMHLFHHGHHHGGGRASDTDNAGKAREPVRDRS